MQPPLLIMPLGLKALTSIIRPFSCSAASIRSNLKRSYSKGALYLSSLKSSRNSADLLNQFIEIKNKSRLPTFLYLIQRL